MQKYAGKDKDEWEPRRGNHSGNSRPEDSGDRASQPLGLSGQNGSPGGQGATRAADNAGDGPLTKVVKMMMVMVMVMVMIMIMTCIVAQVRVSDGSMYCQTKNKS